MRKPPVWLYRLLEACCPPNRVDVLGDFEEWYAELAEEKGALSANWTFIIHSISMLRLKSIVKSSKTQTVMLGLHARIARRNLSKQKLYSLINLTGLVTGLTVCTLIGLFIQHELSYDRHFQDYENVYRIAGEYDQGGDTKTRSTLTPYLLLPTLANNLDSKLVFTRLDYLNLHVEVGERSFWEDYSLAVDSTFFEVFQTTFISGNLYTALDDPSGIVLNQSAATKYFGDGPFIGKTLEANGNTYTVTGVIKDFPEATHFEAQLFIPMISIADSYPYWMTQTYGGVSHRTYFRTPEVYDVERLEKNLNDLMTSYADADTPPSYFFQPIKDIHLTSELVAELGENGSYRTLYIFITTAFVILLLACINFINLSIAGSLGRLKEIGVKKVLGATRQSQVWQFQIEAFLIGSVASILTILCAELALPTFNQITGKAITLSWSQDLIIVVSCLLLTFLISLVSGSFPALFLLKVPLSKAISGTTFQQRRSRIQPRNVLVGIQFFLSAILIASTLIILRQLEFMRSKDLGIDSEQLLVASIQAGETSGNYDILKNRLLQESSVVNVAAANTPLSSRVGGWRQYRKANSADRIQIPTAVVSHDFFETIDAEFALGRAFSKEFLTDYSEAYIINEEAARFLELEDPLGANLKGSAFTGEVWSTKDAKIVGVVKDFHFASLHDKIRPVVFSLSSEATIPLRWLFIKVKPENIIATLEKIEATWQEVNPETPLRYRFLDDAIAEHYLEEARFLKVFSTFAVLSIFIGCLGLFGLTAFIMKRRTKEIGIRKVLGASQINMLSALSADFMQLVLISTIFGIPITIWLMANWLKNFEYRVNIEWWVFVVTALGALLAALLSILYHSNKVAKANPVDSIKYE